MRKLLFLSLLVSIILVSCDNTEEVTPLEAKFTATVTGEAPNAQIELVNNSTGATSYNWTFSDGAGIESSTDKTPATLTVDKAGDFKIDLIVSDGTVEKAATLTIQVPGYSAIVEYKDLEFALDAGNATYGRLFSFETGKMYLDNEITSDNGSKINLAFGSLGQTMYYFESPDVADYNVPNATTTKIVNYESPLTISPSDFADMTDDRLLKDLVIVTDNESFGNSQIPDHTILFEIASGQKGVIITKSVNNDRLLVDIKIQKY